MVKNDKQYYLYIDDSGKFHNEKVNHVIYAGLLFENLKDIEIIKKKYIENLKQLKNLPLNIQNAKYEDYPIEQWLFFLKEFKSNDMIDKYQKFIKTKNLNNKKILENLFDLYKIPTSVSSVVWCKANTKVHNYKDHLENTFHKEYMILALIKKMFDNNFIEKNSDIFIFIDEEDDVNLDENFIIEKALEYLNLVPDNPVPRVNKMRFKLFINNISVKGIKFLPSHLDVCLQLADWVANLTYKAFTNSKALKRNYIYDYFTNNLKIKYLTIPYFDYNNIEEQITCSCGRSLKK